MKVQELINILNKMNPELEVLVYIDDTANTSEIEQVTMKDGNIYIEILEA